MDPVTASQFYMWRACVAFMHLDKKISVEERKWIAEKVNHLNLTTEQRRFLESDVEKDSNFDEIYKKITEKKDLAFLVNTIRVVGYLDKDFSETERASFKRLEAIVMAGVDLKAISEEMKIFERESYHEDEVYKVKNTSSIFEAFHNSFLRFINPGDYKFPKK